MAKNKLDQEFMEILAATKSGKALAESPNLIRISDTNAITDKDGICLKLDGYFDLGDLQELKRALDGVIAMQSKI